MVVPELTHLDEQDLSAKIIDDPLIALCLPPFDRHIIFAPRSNDPEGRVLSGHLVHLGVPRPFQIREMNVPLKSRGLDVEAEALV